MEYVWRKQRPGVQLQKNTIEPDTMGTENEPSEQAGRGMVQRRDSQLKQVADSIHSLQRRISNIGADLTAEDINALLDPSSMVATTLADTQEREETTTLEQKTEIERRPIDARHVRRDGT
jgi:hypothetical protein